MQLDKPLATLHSQDENTKKEIHLAQWWQSASPVSTAQIQPIEGQMKGDNELYVCASVF